MALPSGYKRLEYIQSSGTQYIDTGFKPNQNTRIVMDAYLTHTTSSVWYKVYGGGDGNIVNAVALWVKAQYNYELDYGTGYDTLTVSNPELHIDQNKNTAVLNGEELVNTEATFQSSNNLFIFNSSCIPNKYYKAEMKLYSFSVYDNGTIARDYIPCETTDGEVGLWDDVNGVFYGNAGTGTFTAGPVVIAIPDHPSNLHQAMAVRLAWAAVSGAERYNVYRDGTLLATTTDLAYVDDTAAENTEYTYGVSAVNSAGESPKTTLTVYTKTGYFLYKPVVESATFQ